MLAAVALAAASPRMDELGEEALAQQLLGAAERITRRLAGDAGE
jgi:DNA-binding IclR family transcriptional regulator